MPTLTDAYQDPRGAFAAPAIPAAPAPAGVAPGATTSPPASVSPGLAQPRKQAGGEYSETPFKTKVIWGTLAAVVLLLAYRFLGRR